MKVDRPQYQRQGPPARGWRHEEAGLCGSYGIAEVVRRSWPKTLGQLGMMFLLLVGCGPAPTPETEEGLEQALETITADIPRSHVRFLAHDLLRGRGTGDVGFEIAREYMVAQFERIGLKPDSEGSFLQEFGVLSMGDDRGSELAAGAVRLNSRTVRFLPAFQEGGEHVWEGDAVFLGHGLYSGDRNDYADVDVSGKAVVFLGEHPDDWPLEREPQRFAVARAEYAMRQGAEAVVEVSRPTRPAASGESALDAPRGAGPFAPDDGTVTSIRPHAVVGPEGSQELLAHWRIDDPTEAVGGVGQLRLERRHVVDTLRSWNVVGHIEGSDPEVGHEVIVFSSHLDHVGICAPDATGDDICNGAHDNALGTAQMLAAAEIMADLQPRRSIVFASVGAEEGGLVGSWHYVRNPRFPIEHTVANLNMDGGRMGAKTDDLIANATDFSEMEEIVAEVMEEIGVRITHGRSPAELVGLSSDHRSFLFSGVPVADLKPGYSVAGDTVVGFADRMHYMNTRRHRPADVFDESATFESAVEMARRAVRIAWRLSELDDRPQLNPDHPIARPRASPDGPYYFGHDFPRGQE